MIVEKVQYNENIIYSNDYKFFRKNKKLKSIILDFLRSWKYFFEGIDNIIKEEEELLIIKLNRLDIEKLRIIIYIDRELVKIKYINLIPRIKKEIYFDKFKYEIVIPLKTFLFLINKLTPNMYQLLYKRLKNLS